MSRARFQRSRFLASRVRPLFRVGPSTAEGLGRAVRRTETDGVPPAHATLRSTAELGIDELFLAAQTFVRRVPSVEEIRGQLPAVKAAAEALANLAPGDLHTPIEAGDIEVIRRKGWRRSWELLTYSAPFELPPVLMSAADRLSYEGSLQGRVRILRHDEPRPWVIVVHGAQQGRDSDLWMLRARYLHEELRLNIALPVLPLHGPRRTSPVTDVPGFDALTNITHALAAVAEVRAVRQWIATDDNVPVGIFGVSLGGYIAALTAGVDPGFDVVVAAIPVVSPHRLMARQLMRLGGQQGRELAELYLSAPVLELERFVDPLRFEPATPTAHRHVLAGLLDGVTTPQQALELARHWRVESVRWYGGGHLGHAWSSTLRADVDVALLELHSPTLERSFN